MSGLDKYLKQSLRHREKCTLKEMDKGVVILLVVSATAVSVAGYGVRECPPWFEWVNTSDSSGYCACAAVTPSYIHCDQIHQTSYLFQGSCTFYDAKHDKLWESWCPYLFPDDVLQDDMFPLPANVSELNTVVCGNLTREVKGPMCGRCTANTGPSIYSVGSRCVHCTPVNILYYLLLQYGPSTLIFLLVIIFRPNITSAPMLHYVLFCNFTVLISICNFWLYSQSDRLTTVLAKSTLTLSAIWSFDVLIFVSPPLCISQHMEEIYILYLDFIATIYPFILLLLTYALIKLHSKNFKPIVVLWRLSSRLFVRFYRAWDPRSAMIQAFASLFFLSYAKLSYLIWAAFAWNYDRTADGHETTYILYIDPNVPYHSTKHTLLMIFAATVGLFCILPPLLILLVYSTSLYRKISDRISPVWRIRIQTYVEIFYSSVKDGTTATKDYRLLSTLFLFVFGLLPHLVTSIAFIVEKNFTSSLYISAIIFGAVAFLCTVLQPYKVANGSITGLLIVLSLMFGLSASIYENPHKNPFNNRVLSVLIAVPHSVFWCYIVWRVIKKRAVCSCTKPQRCDAERETLLHTPGNCE